MQVFLNIIKMEETDCGLKRTRYRVCLPQYVMFWPGPHESGWADVSCCLIRSHACCVGPSQKICEQTLSKGTIEIRIGSFYTADTGCPGRTYTTTHNDSFPQAGFPKVPIKRVTVNYTSSKVIYSFCKTCLINVLHEIE